MHDSETERRLTRLFELYGQRYEEYLGEILRSRLATAGDVYVFGAGQNGRNVAACMRAAGRAPTAFLDDTPAKIGTVVDGVRVVATDALQQTPGALVVVSVYLAHHDYLAIAQRLRKLGANSMSMLQFLWAAGRESLPFYFHDSAAAVLQRRDELVWLSAQLADRQSADELCAHVEFRLSLRHEVLPAWTLSRLPPPSAWQRIGFVDAGAFDGDTVIPFVRSFGERTAFAIALEPDESNYAALRANLDQLPPALHALIEPLARGVAASSGTASFTGMANAASTLSANGDTTVRTVSIDDLLADKDAEHLYLKFDVEGSERDAIRGAAETIRAHAPFIAMSVYHRPNDLWELPQLIARLNGDYRFVLRSHGADGADLTAYAVAPADLDAFTAEPLTRRAQNHLVGA